MKSATYFARISSRNSPANKLQQAILMQLDSCNNLLVGKPDELFSLIETATDKACRTHRRCTPVKVYANRSFPDKAITSISITGLVTLSLHEVVGMFGIKSRPEPAQEEQPEAVPEPPPIVVETTKPRQAILSSREGGKEERLECWDRFSGRVQTLLHAGRIWNIYRDPSNQIVAEEYGGQIHPAF